MSHKLSSPGCGHQCGEPDWEGGPGLVSEKRENALAYINEHPMLKVSHPGQYVAYCDGKRVGKPLSDKEALQAHVLEILRTSETIRGKLLCIFKICKSTKNVLVPEVQE